MASCKKNTIDEMSPVECCLAKQGLTSFRMLWLRISPSGWPIIVANRPVNLRGRKKSPGEARMTVGGGWGLNTSGFLIGR